MNVFFIKKAKGYLRVSLSGTAPERFLNLCRNRNILIWNIQCKETGYEFCIGIEDYKSLRPIVRKTKTMPYIKEKSGLPFFIMHWKKRKGFVGGLFLFIGMIYFLSQLVWSIEISGQYTHTKEQLIKFLNKNEIHTGIFMRDVNCTLLEEMIRKEYEDIGWVSAQIDGTRLLIQIKETNMPSIYQKETIPVHLVAPKDGRIDSIITRTGTPKVKAGDEVKAGDILISGVVEIIGDGETIIRKSTVVADGDIFLETTYNYNDEKEFIYIGKEYTGRNKIFYSVQWNEKNVEQILPLNFFEAYQKFDTVIESWSFQGLIFQKKTQREYLETEKVAPKEEVKSYLQKKFNRYLEKIAEKGVIIKRNNVKIKEVGKKLMASGNLVVLEPVTSYRKILDSEWRSTLENEHSGNDN